MVSRRTCPVCTKEFLKTNNRHLYCSKVCYNRDFIKPIKKLCRECGNEFIRTKIQKFYCSKTCANKVFVKPIKLCKECGNEFIREKNRQLYCSESCANKVYYKKYHTYDKRKSYLKNWRENSDSYKKHRESEKRKEYERMYARSDKRKELDKKYRGQEKNKLRRQRYMQQEKVREQQKEYIKSDRGKKMRSERNFRRRRTEPLFKLKMNMRTRLRSFLKTRKISKKNSTFSITGCTPVFLKEYLEKQFYPHPKTNEPMTWKNHGREGWHIDHRLPLDGAKTYEDLYKLCHYTNLQPMWAEENRKKSNRF